MPTTLGELRTQTLTRLGDTEEAIWTADEVNRYLREGYQILARKGRVFWDQLYSEDLPSHFSVTQPWELAMLDDFSGGFNFGVANYTMDDERLLLDDEDDRLGPAWYTSPGDMPFLDDVSANVSISATDELPDSVAELDRLTWNNRTIDAVTARNARASDSRYELNAGEVFAYTWQQDGVRTLRKIMVPAQQGDVYTVNGSWGILRDASDISDETVTGTWGALRQLSGEHPMGSEAFGLTRRVYQDGMNVRIEHFRQGRPMDAAQNR